MLLHTRTQLVTDPSVEPVSLGEAREHLRVTHSDEDASIAALITAARVTVETITRRSFISQTWRLFLDRFPSERGIRLPHTPVQSVTGIEYFDENGELQTFPAGDYWLDAVSSPARLSLKEGKAWATTEAERLNAVAITYVAGYGSAPEQVPSPVRHAIKLLVAHLYENPDIVSAGQLSTIPMSCDYLLAPYRVVSFF